MIFPFNDMYARIARGKDGGGGGGYSPPPAPDPELTAAAQGKQDRLTAQTNALTLNPTVKSPYGTISYDVNSFNPNNPNSQVNRPTQTTTLAPAQQQQLDYKNNIMTALGGLGENWAKTFQPSTPLTYDDSRIPTNIDYSNVSATPNMADYQDAATHASKAYYDQAYALMQPDLDAQGKYLDNRLIQSGNPMASEGYQAQMGAYQRTRDAALSNLANQSVNEGYNVQNQLFNNANITRQNQISAAQLPYQTQQMLAQNRFAGQQAQQNQNINGMSALLNGTQAIQNPQVPMLGQYSQAAQTSPNLMGMAQSNYQNQLASYNNQYNANQASNNAATSGLFSLAGSIGSLFF